MFRRALISAAALSVLLTTGCAPLIRMTPSENAVILLPERSKSQTTGHFRHSDSTLVWVFNPNAYKQPTEVLSQVAPNRPVRNVSSSVQLNMAQYLGTLVLAFGSQALVFNLAKTPEQILTYGTLVPLAFLTLLPQSVETTVEGDFAERPADLGIGK